MIKFIQIGLVCGLIMGLINCRKDHGCTDPTNPKCPNYNPCSIVHPLSAAFNIYEYTGNAVPGSDTNWYYYPTDTVYTNFASFSVVDTTVDSVRWAIGAGSYTSRSFSLDFTNVRPTPVPITLTVYKHRNSCYPTDDTVKTLTKKLYFTDTCLAFGTYKGYFNNNPADTGTISIMKTYADTSGFLDPYNIVVAGFVPGCSDFYCCYFTNGTIDPFYLSIYFITGSIGTCQGASGALYFNPNNDSVISNYTLVNNSEHHFKGIKIH